MDDQNDSCVLLFVKYPVKGQVKTRLAAHIGQKKALRLYKNSVLDTLTLLKGLDDPVRIFFDPANAEKQFKEWLGMEYAYAPQTGADLGQRMKNAFGYCFDEGFQKAILIGSDIPDLPVEFLSEALDALESNEAVIGPSKDGGYYLIGFTQTSFLPVAFDNITWSASTVCRKTQEILRNNKLNVHLLREWSDVDTEVDLQSLLSRNRLTPFRHSITYRFLTAEGMWSAKNV
jgi:rSAM/selenodomain-associated transferase 1